MNPHTTLAPPPSTESATSETKDFVEHLRSVHFALVVVCLGLMVITTQPTRPELQTAYDQARDITEAVRRWDRRLIESEATSQVKNIDDMSPAFGRVDSLPKPPEALEVGGKRYNVVFRDRNWGFLRQSPLNTMLHVREFDGAPLEVDPPKNLAGFRALWDSLVELTAWGGGELASDACIREGSPIGGTTETWHKWSRIDPSPKYKTLSFSLGAFPFSDDVAVPQQLRGHLGHAFVSEGGTPQVLIPTVVEVPVAIVDGQAVLIRTSRRWRHKPYVRAFEELYAVTRDFENVNLETIERIVESDLKRSKDVFQAFSISFPVETTAPWGVLMVLTVQVYLLFHLAEFRRRNMHNVTVAWIGLYPSWGPRLMYFSSSCLVPVIVVFHLVPKSGFPAWILPWLIDGSLILLSLAVATLSAREYFRIQTSKTRTPAIPSNDPSGSGA